MLEVLKEKVYLANLELVSRGLVVQTWGNVSAVDREAGVFVIKPSGIAYDSMKPEDMVVVGLDGRILEGQLKPSSDTPTHLELYRAWPEVGGIAHSHSPWATSWAQAQRPIPPFGTTHADTFYGPIPCTSPLTKDEIEHEYEKSTGEVIVRTFKKENVAPLAVPAVVVGHHGPFTWGKSAAEAVEKAVILEEVAKIAAQTLFIAPGTLHVGQYLLDKHYRRKHGPDAYYGQKRGTN